jgi:FkbM family methyltransferase
METVELNGVKIPLDPALMSEKIREQLRAGRYETGEARCLRQLIEPGDAVIELGAGIGYLTALAGVLGAGVVVAVEANPELIPLIREIHRLNGVESQAFNAAITLKPGTDTLPFHLHHDLWASSVTPLKTERLRATLRVPALPLAEFLSRRAPCLLIIDIEVLRGWLDSEGLDGFDPGAARKALVELKPGRFSPAEIKLVFDAFSERGFYCDPAISGGGVVLFRRLD